MSLGQQQSQSKMHIIASSICQSTPGMEDISYLITEGFHCFSEEVFTRKRNLLRFREAYRGESKTRV